MCPESNNAIGQGAASGAPGVAATGTGTNTAADCRQQGDDSAQRDQCQATDTAWSVHDRIVLLELLHGARDLLTNLNFAGGPQTDLARTPTA